MLYNPDFKVVEFDHFMNLLFYPIVKLLMRKC